MQIRVLIVIFCFTLASSQSSTPSNILPSNAVTNFNADPVTVTYAGQCSGNNAINLMVTAAKGGEPFKPDAANPGGGVPCDEYFELSFSFVSKSTGSVINFAVSQNSFFNAKQLKSDGNGNIIVQFSPEINGFGSGFLTLGAGLACAQNVPNFVIRTNYLLTSINDGTYNRMLNEVIDAGALGSGTTISTAPSNVQGFGLGLPQCNIAAQTPIAFPFPA